MPDILIRGMEMPEGCEHCPMYDSDYGICNFLSTFYREGGEGRLDDCPLHELPEHGDLIDGDAVLNKIDAYVCGSQDSEFIKNEIIKAMPIIVPASEGGANDPKT